LRFETADVELSKVPMAFCRRVSVVAGALLVVAVVVLVVLTRIPP
jgi:hypothetical protein